MSALSDLVAGLKSTPTQTVGSSPTAVSATPSPTSKGFIGPLTPSEQAGKSSPPMPTQDWNGQKIPATIPTKNLVNYDATTGNKTFKLPAFAGGGVYTEDTNGHLVTQGHTTYGGVSAQSGQERDDIVPQALGGTNSNPQNIQMQAGFKTGGLADQSDKFENQIIDQVRSGQVQPKDAIAQVLAKKQELANKPGFWANLSSAVDDFNKGIAGTMLGTPARFAASAAEVPQTLATGKATGKTYSVPGLDPFQSIQSEEQQNINQGMSPAKAAGIGTVNTIGSGIATLGLGEAVNEGMKGLTNPIETPKIEAPKATPTEIPKTEVSSKTLQAKIQDATPNYEKSMVGQNIKNSEGKTIPRINEGKGLTGTRTVNPSASEIANAQELANVKNYPEKGTALDKSIAVRSEISNEAQGLRNSLQAEDKARPLNPKAKDIVYKNVFDNMDGDARTAVMLRGKGTEFSAKAGISEADAEAMFGKSPKSVVGKYGTDVADALGQYDGSRAGILDLRQKLDDIYKDYRGKSAFGSDHRNALDEMHSNIRDYLNKELKESTTNTDTQASLDKQTRLYRAKDVLDNKAEDEATTALGRYGQKHTFQRKIATSLPGRIAAGTIIGAGLGGSAYTIGKKVGAKLGNPLAKPAPPKPKVPPKPKAQPKVKL